MNPCLNFFMLSLPLLLLAILLPSVLCADSPKPKPAGKKKLLQIHPDTLLTKCGYLVGFEDIFTTPGICSALFGKVTSYSQSIGILGLLSLSEVPIEDLYNSNNFDENLFEPILNYPALNQKKVYMSNNNVTGLFEKKFDIPLKR